MNSNHLDGEVGGIGRSLTGVKVAMCAKEKGARPTMEPQRVECDGHGVERLVWDGKTRAGKTSWFFSLRAL